MGFEKTAKETLPASARESGETLSERERKKRSRFFPSLSLSLSAKAFDCRKKKKRSRVPINPLLPLSLSPSLFHFLSPFSSGMTTTLSHSHESHSRSLSAGSSAPLATTSYPRASIDESRREKREKRWEGCWSRARTRPRWWGRDELKHVACCCAARSRSSSTESGSDEGRRESFIVMLFFPSFLIEWSFFWFPFFFSLSPSPLLSPPHFNFTLSLLSSINFSTHTPALPPALLHATMSAVASASRVSLSRPAQRVSARCRRRGGARENAFSRLSYCKNWKKD